MTNTQPETRLNPDFSSDGATETPWQIGRATLEDAPIYWVSTVTPEGRPNVAPLLAVWMEGALYFNTGRGERKAKNLAQNPKVTITTGNNSLRDELDIVVEGDAVEVNDEARLQRLSDAFGRKYGDGWRLPEVDGVVTFEVAPIKAFGFGRGDGETPPPGGGFSQTRWRFRA